MFKKAPTLFLIIGLLLTPLAVLAQPTSVSSSSLDSSSLSSAINSSLSSSTASTSSFDTTSSSSSESSATSSAISSSSSSSSSSLETSVPQTVDNLEIPNNSGILGNQVVVKLKTPKTNKEIENSLRKNLKDGFFPIKASSATETTAPSDLLVFNLETGSDLKATISKFQGLSDVEYAQPNYRYQSLSTNPTQNPSYVSKQWNLRDSNTNPYGIYAQTAWQNLNTALPVPGGNSGGLSTVKIAVIDSGVNTALADFSGLNVVNPALIFGKTSTCSPGVGEEFLAGPFPDGPNSIYICKQSSFQYDDDGHGTAVASIISAQDNTTSGVGIAHKTSLMPIALHNYGFTTYGIAQAIKHAIDNGAKVINLSLGTTFRDTAVEQELQNAYNANISVVASSGNCGAQLGRICFPFLEVGDPGYNVINPIVYPAAYPSVISVGAINPNGTRAAYSTFNSEVDVVAPVGSGNTAGNAVMTLCGLGNNSVNPTPVAPSGNACNGLPTGSEIYKIGTSFAAPQVAGAIGLLLSKDNTLSTDQVKAILEDNTLDLGVAGKDPSFGSGLIRASNITDLPAVSITSPTDNSEWNLLSDNISVAATATHSSGIAKVEFYLNNAKIGEDTDSAGGYTITINHNTSPSDIYSLTAKATSNSGAIFTNEIILAFNYAWNFNNFDILDSKTENKVSMAKFNGVLYKSIRSSNNRLLISSSIGGYDWTPWTQLDGQISNEPNLIVFDNKLFISARGIFGNVFTRSTLNGTTWTNWDGNAVTNQDKISTIVFNSRLYQAIRGTGNGLFIRSTADGTTWTPWTQLDGQISNEPNLIVFDNKLFISARGIFGNVFTRSSSDGTTWTNWDGNAVTNQDRITTVVFNSRLYQVIRGTGNSIFIRSTLDGTTWSAWTEIPAQISDEPTLAVINSKLVLAVRGIGGNLFAKSSNDGTTWSIWYASSELIQFSPTLTPYENKGVFSLKGLSNNSVMTSVIN